MGINFVSKKDKSKKDNNIDKKNIIDFKDTEIKVIGTSLCKNNFIFPMKKIEEKSNLGYIGYIKESNTLFVQFMQLKKSPEGIELGLKSEPIGYYYHNVSEEVYNKLLKSKSKSNFFNKNIKHNYEFHLEPIINDY